MPGFGPAPPAERGSRECCWKAPPGSRALADQLIDHQMASSFSAAFDALSFLNPRLITSGEVADFDHLSMRALVRHLGQPGTQARWANRPEVDPNTCNPRGFAHLMPGARHELRTGYASWLRERSARHAAAIKISPPPVTDTRSGSAQLIIIEAGCLICGVSHQVMPAVEVAQHGRMTTARQIWRPLRTNATQLGARSSLEVSGFVCKICADPVEMSTRSAPRPWNGA